MTRQDQIIADSRLAGGPALEAWPRTRFGRIRPHKGGGGGDGGAREMEQERQQRVQSAINTINSIFDGADRTVGINRASTYQPGQTYYDANGKVFVVPTKKEQRQTGFEYPGSGEGGGPIEVYETYQVPDQNAINAALSRGLYTGTQTIKGQSRQGLYDQQREAVTQLNADDVNRQYTDAERANRFGLARAGLLGGSADIDSNAELQRITNEGLIKASGLGDQAAADLQTSDERARQNLISMAQSGIDTGAAGQMALQQLDANSQNAASARSGSTIGNLFGNLAQAYLYGQQQQGLNAGMRPYQSQFIPGYSNSRTTYQGSTS